MELKKILAIPFLFVSLLSVGQTQLVLLSREKVLVRYSIGDEIVYKLKKSKEYTSGVITDIKPFSVITFNDTIQFMSIERVSLKGHPQARSSSLSKFLMTAGIGYFLLDQVNNVIVQGNPPDMEPTVWKPSLVLFTTGFLLKTIHRRSRVLRYPVKLLMAERGTKFYKPDQ